MDELFELDQNPNFAAVQTCISNPAKTSSYPKYWKPENCPYTHGENSDGHDLVYEHGRLFNSGLFVFHPNLVVFEQMIAALNTWDLTDFIFADQDFLNQFYRSSWKR
ncbi:unnamed protein product [Rotaria magnacalcarata]|nr:unnamed protein product [Rotaria magnacalcarata]CAF2180687.1 unnamed protein product [Rotaria magnacalcarata]